MEEGREVAHGGGAADLSGASGRVAAEAGCSREVEARLRQCGSGHRAPERQCDRGMCRRNIYGATISQTVLNQNCL